MPLPGEKKFWRVDVDLREGEDFKLHFSTQEEALSAIESIMEKGYITRDHALDSTKYEISSRTAPRISPSNHAS